MKAIVQHAFGGPDVLKYEDVPDPIAGDGLLLVNVRAIGVNPAETYVRDGKYPALPSLPFVPGTELAGEIAEGQRKGERVFALGTAGQRMTGTYAELAVVRDSQAHPLPDHVTFEQGAALPVAFATAWRAVHDRGRMRAGETVLVHGASGGVGSACVQLASASGGTVIGTASTPEGHAAALADGAAFVVNHREPDYRDKIKAFLNGRPLDLIVEMLANVNLDDDLDLLSHHGRVVVVGSRGGVEIDPRKTMTRELDIRGMTLWGAGEDRFVRLFAGVVALLKRQAIAPRVGQTFPLAQAADAHRAVMSDAGRTGKIVLIP